MRDLFPLMFSLYNAKKHYHRKKLGRFKTEVENNNVFKNNPAFSMFPASLIAAMQGIVRVAIWPF